MTPPQRCYHGAAKIADKVYIIGGMEGIEPRNTVVEFDLNTKISTNLEPLPQAVSNMAIAVWGSWVFIFGGRDDINNKILKTAIMYDVNYDKTRKPSYKTLDNMKTNRCGCTAVTIGDKIIVMGGEDENGALNTVECYDVVRHEWTEFPAMTEARAYATAAKCDVQFQV